MYAHERNLILNPMFLHICRNCETALINCLIVLIFVCGIVVFICVCSIARTGCYMVQLKFSSSSSSCSFPKASLRPAQSYYYRLLLLNIASKYRLKMFQG